MNVAIVGDEEAEVTYDKDKIYQIISALVTRIISKYPDCIFLTGDHRGVEKITLRILKEREITRFVLVTDVEYDHPLATVTFFDYHNPAFLGEFADYVVILSNGQRHSRLDKIRKASKMRLEINYLSEKEKWY